MLGDENMDAKTAIPEGQESAALKMTKPPLDWGVLLSWLVTGFIVAAVALFFIKTYYLKTDSQVKDNSASNMSQNIPLPDLVTQSPEEDVYRVANIYTNPPEGIRYNAVKYTVETGDSIFMIAKKF